MAFVKLADNYTDLIGKFAVALLAEGVGRNIPGGVHLLQLLQSPSSRRAWIEMRSRPQHRRQIVYGCIATRTTSPLSIW